MLTVDITGALRFIDAGAFEKKMHLACDAAESLLERRCPGKDMTGWISLPQTDARELETIGDAAKRIQDENDCMVVIGIGGSYLGAKAVIEALPGEASFPVIFAGQNISPEYHDRLIGSLDGKRYALCVISKSGTTTEPAIAFRLLRSMLYEKLGRETAARHIIAITDPKAGALRRMAAENGFTSFTIPPDVGGRFSVLSPVGLVPCAVAGVPIAGMMEAAGLAMDEYSSPDGGNEALRYALLRNMLQNKGTRIEVLSTFHPELAMFCEWWKQLAGESEGKSGKGLFPASTVMTTDLHSLGQYLQEGPRDILETFLVAASPRTDITIPSDEADLDNLNYIAGKTLSKVNRMAFEGTISAHSSGDLPVIRIEIPSVAPGAVGSLIVFFEIAVAVSAILMGVNPFDQPGVEEYKTRMFKLLGKPGKR